MTPSEATSRIAAGCSAGLHPSTCARPASPGRAMPRTCQSASQPRETKALDKRHRDTADILARHLGKPEELAAEIFRPKDANPIQSSAPKASVPAQAAPALAPEVAQTLSGMVADLKGLRAAVEFMAEQVQPAGRAGRPAD